MDRKRQGIIDDLSGLSTQLQDFKSDQPSGADTTLIRCLGTPYDYDGAYTLAPNERKSVYAFFTYGAYLKPWQESAYAEIYPQFYLDNLNKKYEGGALDKVLILVTYKDDTATDVLFYFQVLNTDIVPRTLYVKYLTTTTALGGQITV